MPVYWTLVYSTLVSVGKLARAVRAIPKYRLDIRTASGASLFQNVGCVLSEQKRVANEVEQRVAGRTSGPAEANEELRKEIAQRKKIEERLLKSEAALQNAFDEIKKSEAKLRQVIDAIPTLAWCDLPDGPNEFLNKGWHEYRHR